MTAGADGSTTRRRWVPWATVGGAGLALITTLVVVVVTSSAGASPSASGTPSPTPSATPAAIPEQPATPAPTPSATEPVGCPAPATSSRWVSDAALAPIARQPGLVDIGLYMTATGDPLGFDRQAESIEDGTVLVGYAPTTHYWRWGSALYRAVDVPSGHVKWTVDFPETTEGWTISTHVPLETGLGAIIFELHRAGEARLIALDPETGAELSRADFGAVAIAGPVPSAMFTAPDYSADYWIPALSGRMVTSREDLILQTDAGVVAVRPSDLSSPIWRIESSPSSWTTTFGDVVFVDAAAHRRSDGSALGWIGESPHESFGLIQLGDLLFDRADGSTLAQIDPLTGEPCIDPVPVRYAANGPDGYFVVDADGVIGEYGPTGERRGTLGALTGTGAGVIAGRFTEILDGGGLRLHHGGGDVVDLPMDLTAYTDDLAVGQSPHGGPITLYDLASGDAVWTSAERPVAEVWGGYLETAVDDPLYRGVELLLGAP